MAFADFETRRLHCKVLYFGPRGAGKTTNLRAVLKHSSAEWQQNSSELTPVEYEDNPFFEFLPVSIGSVKEHHVKVHLYAFPPHRLYSTVYSVMLKGIDGMVFVADSAMDKLDDNLMAWQETQDILAHEGILMSHFPAVIQYNKRDLKNALPTEILRDQLNTLALPEIEANALNGTGVMQSLGNVVERFMEQLA
ncbi:MAG: ADP-ribosylation factor-like protein [Proteobacteria bacterium]|nr:ADP-ribosylation factor-like protein [Pseudomonadota bacterium]